MDLGNINENTMFTITSKLYDDGLSSSDSEEELDDTQVKSETEEE